MDLLTFVLLALFVFFASFLASMVGIGGGVFYVPILVLIFGFSMKEAVPLSLAMILPTSIGATINYLKSGKVILKLGLFLEPVTLIGATFGFYFHLHTGQTILVFLFSLVLFLSSIKIFTGSKRAYNDVENGFFPFSFKNLSKNVLLLALLFSFLAGFFSASLGIGGGVIKVPILHLVLGVSMRNSVGTSSFMIVITTMYSLLLYGSFGRVNLGLALPLAIATFFGAFSGSKFALSYVKVERIRMLFAVILIVAAIRMLFQSVF